MRFLAFLFAAFLIGPMALAQAPTAEKIEFKPSAEHPIATLAVLGVRATRRFVVQNGNPAGTAIGVDIDKKSAEYVEALGRRGITLAPELARELHRQLGRKFKVVWYTGRVPLKADKTPDYEKIPIEADAILHVFYGQVGYYAPSADSSYFPLVQLGARMVDRKSWQTVYYSQLAYRPPGWRAQVLYYAADADPRYGFANFEALMAGFERSVEGLVLGQNRLAARIAHDLGVPEKKGE